jgi:UDP-N-acetylmuramate: L-alanyl-gamma-D-glutamyl-meso-diaminopimelate ligase
MGDKKHIHMLGICGTGMTSLATLLKDEGHLITGSDENVYPPMSTQLESLGIQIKQGYRAEHLGNTPDQVIVGNVIRRDNPEALSAIERGIPYSSMPQALSDYFLGDRTPVVVAGTHGKTTLSTLTSWLLDAAGEDPGFFIGGIGRNFGTGARKGSGNFFVIEGDEYDTAFFDKGPKFLHYRPQAVILTSVEFDHADIYRDVEHVEESFCKLMKIIPEDGLLIACNEFERVHKIARNAECKVVWYGQDDGDYCAKGVAVEEDGTSFTLMHPEGESRLKMPLFGAHNLQNVIAASAILIESGIDPEKIQTGLSTFRGVARRQDLVGEAAGVIVIDDFAHHPTAVAKTIDAIRARYPGKRLWALFEPRSNTSRRNVFQDRYALAFANADQAIIGHVHRADSIPKNERMDTKKLASDITAGGTNARAMETTDEMLDVLDAELEEGDVVLIMSNGSFDNIAKRLVEKLEGREG